ncbi:hypothetical protein Hanom_Chr07g00611511 [Helianthus anomalus]
MHAQVQHTSPVLISIQARLYMSGEGSSSGARGRRRGPTAQPRGSPTREQQVVSNKKERCIRYEGHE